MASNAILQKQKTHYGISTDGRQVRKHTEEYHIESSGIVSTLDAIGLLGLSLLEPCPYDPAATLRAFDCDRITKAKSPWRYRAIVEYSTETQQRSQNENPFNDPIKFTCDSEEGQLSILYDRNGDPILNTADDWIDPPIQVPFSKISFTFTRNEAYFVNPLGFVDCTNQSPIWGGDVDHWLCKKIGSSFEVRSQIPYWPTTYVFSYSRIKWQPHMLSQGKREKNSGKIVDICDERHGGPISEPVPLDSSGVRVPASSLPSGAHFFDVEALPQAEFYVFNLPNPG